jgi:hypothetical protein
VERRLPAADDAPHRRVERDVDVVAERFGKELAQPFLLDPCREGEQHLALFVAALDLANLGGHEQRRAMHHALTREHAASAVHERAAQRPLIEPHRHLIREAGQHAPLNRTGRSFCSRDV